METRSPQTCGDTDLDSPFLLPGIAKAITDNASTGLFMMDGEGRCTFMNPAAERMTAYSFAEVRGQILHELIHHRKPDGQPLPFAECFLREVLMHLRPVREIEQVFIRKDGSCFPVICTASPILEQGTLQGIVLEVRDITPRKKAMTALAESERRFENIANASPIMMGVWDRQGNPTFMSQAWLDFMGLDRETAMRIGWLERIHPEDHPSVLGGWQQVFVEQTRFVSEHRVCCADGTYRWVYAMVTPNFNEQRELIGLFASLVDIHDKKLAEQALQESEARFRIMADSGPAMIWMIDRDGQPEYFSKPWLDFTGQTLEEAVNRGWYDIVHPEDREELVRVASAQFERREQVQVEFRMRRASDGEYRWFFSLGVPRYEPDGQFAGHIGSCIDLTDLKHAQDEIKSYARRLEQSNRDLEQFATIASHDLQAPLRKIAIFSSYIQELSFDVLSDETRDYFRRIQHATSKMQNLVTDLLNLSCVNRKGQPFRKTYLNEVMQHVLADLKYTIRETCGVLEIGDLGMIDADPNQIQQLFQNLVGNALKFQRAGIPPMVKVHIVEEAGNFRTFAVEDNGIGIKPCQMEKIFQPFVRLHGESVYEGSGIGLAICRKIVERHGGELRVESEPGQGSRFLITLPIQQA